MQRGPAERAARGAPSLRLGTPMLSRRSLPAPPPRALPVVGLVVNVVAGAVLRPRDAPRFVGTDVAVGHSGILQAAVASLLLPQPESLVPGELAAAAGIVDALDLIE